MAKEESGKKPRIIAAIPAYNEKKYIGTIVLKTRQYVDEVIVLDDGSSDGTCEIAQLAGATVIRHDSNKGYGAAIQSLLTAARGKNPDILVLLDADSQHDPGDIPRMVKPILEGSDIVIGSRKAQANNVPRYRRTGQKILLYFTRLLSDQRLTDSESGFRSFSRKALAKLELRENGMAISAETIAEAAGKGLKITEVPISIEYTEDGSTLNPIRHGLGVLARILAMISERRPLFFFGAGGIIAIALGLGAGLKTLNTLNADGVLLAGTALLSALLFIIGIFSIFTGIILHAVTGRKG